MSKKRNWHGGLVGIVKWGLKGAYSISEKVFRVVNITPL